MATQAHPRWRGAYASMRLLACQLNGSSPLARGIWKRCCLRPFTTWLIPAGAGHILGTTRRRPKIQAHPRWRGAYYCGLRWGEAIAGSSPLARGICNLLEPHQSFNGLIPAGAGHIWSAPSPYSRSTAHPRWRGAYPRTSIMFIRCSGSSPLARGIWGTVLGDLNHEGLIPAGAGHIPQQES